MVWMFLNLLLSKFSESASMVGETDDSDREVGIVASGHLLVKIARFLTWFVLLKVTNGFRVSFSSIDSYIFAVLPLLEWRLHF